MRLPMKYRECTIESWQPENGQPRKRAEEYLSQWPPKPAMMLLTGTVGNGKTHMACGILRAAFERYGKRGQFWPTIELLNRYRATFNDDTATETGEQVDDVMRRVELLVLDDIGTESDSKFATEKLFQLVNYRYSNDLPLVVTSNVSLNDLPERIRSRMKDGVMAYFDGPDMRGKKR
jgi:DNA replication protein DnaC